MQFQRLLCKKVYSQTIFIKEVTLQGVEFQIFCCLISMMKYWKKQKGECSEPKTDCFSLELCNFSLYLFVKNSLCSFLFDNQSLFYKVEQWNDIKFHEQWIQFVVVVFSSSFFHSIILNFLLSFKRFAVISFSMLNWRFVTYISTTRSSRSRACF